MIDTAARNTPPRFVDLSHTIRAGLVTIPGLPSPSISSHLTHEQSRAVYAPGTEFAMQNITMLGNTGTYLDTPFHRYAEGGDLTGLELDTLAELPAEVFRFRNAADRGIPSGAFTRHVGGAAVLLETGWDEHWGTEAYKGPAPFLTEDAAIALIDAGVFLVGIDSVNIDDTGLDSAGRRPAHSRLLAAGVHVVEHLTGLGDLPDSGARFTAVPPRIEGLGTFPVRAFARLP